MSPIGRSTPPNKEDEYFFKLEQEQREEQRRREARDAETRGLMEAFGIREEGLIRELADAGVDREAFRLLHLIPLVQVAWSDGSVSAAEAERILRVASMRGFNPGNAAYDRLQGWLDQRPSDRFFQASLRGVKAVLVHRPADEASALSRELVWYCAQVAEASGGFFGLGPRISEEEERVLAEVAGNLESTHSAAIRLVAAEIES